MKNLQTGLSLFAIFNIAAQAINTSDRFVLTMHLCQNPLKYLFLKPYLPTPPQAV
jgi:hypothetical protein